MLDEFDPEIDSSIREEREAAQQEQEFARRVNLIIDEKIRTLQEQREVDKADTDAQPPQDELDNGSEADSTEQEQEQKQEEVKPKRASKTRKAVQSILSGSILSSPEMKKLYPYLLATAALLLLLITSTFFIQKLYRQQQHLDNAIKELRTRSVELSAERVQQTSRSSIVKRAGRQGLDIEESVTPVKVIE